MSHEGIQARRRLIAKHERWIGQDLGGERQSLHFTPRKTLHSAGYSNRGVSTFRESELLPRKAGQMNSENFINLRCLQKLQHVPRSNYTSSMTSLTRLIL